MQPLQQMETLLHLGSPHRRQWRPSSWTARLKATALCRRATALFFSWLILSPSMVLLPIVAEAASWKAKDGSEHGFNRHPYYPPDDKRFEVHHFPIVVPAEPKASSDDHYGQPPKHQEVKLETQPLLVYEGPTVKKFDPLPKKPPEIVRGPVVNGVLQQNGVLAYTPFFSQAFLMDYFIFAMYTFLTLIPAGWLVAANLWTNRYNLLRSASRNLVRSSEVSRPVIRDPLSTVG